MNLFFDSNVTIGYVFKGDDWNTQSKNIFRCPNQKYYSQSVLNETKHKIKIIREKLFQGLLVLSSELLRNETIRDYLKLNDVLRFLNSLGFEESIKRKLQKHMHILFSEKYSYEVGKDELSQDIKQEANSLMNDIVIKFNFIQANLTKHHRTKVYISLGNKLMGNNEDFHEEDVAIILDAHDLCHTCNPLTLITADSRRKKDDLIIKFTNIDDVKDLRDFLIMKCP